MSNLHIPNDYVFNEEEMKRKRKTRKEDEKRKKHFQFF